MPFRRAASLVALLLALAGAARAETALTRNLDAYFDALERHGRMHGGVAIVKDGKVLYRRAVGMRTQENGRAVAADFATRYGAGSITKVFTAAMIYQLIDEKKLSLETPLSDFFPSIPNGERITVAHLLSHTSGIGSFPSPDDVANPKSWLFVPQPKQELLARIEKLEPEYQPGEKSTYSNAGFLLLGFMLEAVTRSTYAEQLERRILRPLRLKQTHYGPPPRHAARSFTCDEGKWTAQSVEHPTAAGGAGAIFASPSDLALFMSALFNGRLMSSRSVTEMLTPFSATLRGSEKGIVVFRLRDRNRTAYQHLGGIGAFFGSVTYLPDQNAAIAVLFNGQNYPMGRVFYALVDALAGRAVDVPSFTPVELPDAVLTRREGVYSFPEIGTDLTIRREGRQLSAQATGQEPFSIHAISETTFSHPPSGILIEFRDGHLVLFQGRSEMRFTARQ